MTADEQVTKKFLMETINELRSEMHHNIPKYPQLPYNNEFVFYTKTSEMKQNMDYFRRENTKYKRLYNRCKKIKTTDMISTSLMATGATITGAGVVTSLAGIITLPLTVPATIIGSSLSLTSGTVSMIAKYSHTKEERYITLIEKSQQSLSLFTKKYHKAMEDKKIDETEYKDLAEIYDDYQNFKTSILKVSKNSVLI
jgi:hypothetical protein